MCDERRTYVDGGGQAVEREVDRPIGLVVRIIAASNDDFGQSDKAAGVLEVYIVHGWIRRGLTTLFGLTKHLSEF